MRTARASARESSRMNSKALSVAGFVFAVAALVVLVYTDRVWGTGPISIGLQVAAGLFMLWARITFGLRSFHAAANPTEGELVTSGPFAFVRNPIYAAVLLFTWTTVAVHFDGIAIACGVAITAGMLLRIVMEERELEAHFGAPYVEYCRRVKRLIPFVF